MSRIKDCGSACVLRAPAFGSQGYHIKYQQILIRGVLGLYKKKKKSVLDTSEMEVLPFTFPSENFWHTLLEFSPPFTWMHLGMEMNVELVSLFQLSGV